MEDEGVTSTGGGALEGVYWVGMWAAPVEADIEEILLSVAEPRLVCPWLRMTSSRFRMGAPKWAPAWGGLSPSSE